MFSRKEIWISLCRGFKIINYYFFILFYFLIGRILTDASLLVLAKLIYILFICCSSNMIMVIFCHYYILFGRNLSSYIHLNTEFFFNFTFVCYQVLHLSCWTNIFSGIVVHGGYTNWGPWSPCSRTCAGGLQNRSRSCTNPKPTNGGMNCTGLGPASEERTCNRQRCPGNVVTLALTGSFKQPRRR